MHVRALQYRSRRLYEYSAEQFQSKRQGYSMNASNALFVSSQWHDSASSLLLQVSCIERLAMQFVKNERPTPYCTLGLCISNNGLLGP